MPASVAIAGEFSYVFIKPYRVPDEEYEDLGENREPADSMGARHIEVIRSKADDVEIVIASKVEASVKEIADSYRRLPEEWTTMPDMHGYYGDEGDAATRLRSRLSAFGLTAKPRFIDDADWDDIASWSVKAGTPIRVGTKVAVIVYDVTAP